MKVSELMTTEPLTTTAAVSLKEVVRIMLDNRISGVPVVDDNGTLCGIVTEADILHHESERAGKGLGILDSVRGDEHGVMTVGEAMSKRVITTAPEVDHTVAARLMETRGVKRLPVVDAEGHVLGIISRADIMASFARPDELIADEIERDLLERILWTEPGDVAVEVVDGSVTLQGSVPTKSDRRILEEMSKRLDGVIEVNVDDVSFRRDDTIAGGASSATGL